MIYRSFFASSGDGGSTNDEDTFAVQYPASSPYVTAVGGSFLQVDWQWDPTSTRFLLDMDDYFNVTDNSGQQTEMVWSEAWIQAMFSNGTTGGGVSDLFSMPNWQSPVADLIVDNGNGKSGRGLPDIAWNAAFYSAVFIYNGGFVNIGDYDFGLWQPAGGTSAASPQIAGFFSLINQYLLEQDMDAIGHLNPYLYQITDDSAYNDIQSHTVGTVLVGELTSNQSFVFDDSIGALISGDSFSFTDTPGYPVTEGWDMTTGFGSPNGIDFFNVIIEVISSENE
ncbi:hypothetical protein [uncultured Shewanella sp.]|uniref:hypothetical protein n=1 Tax=uncultured Shewanella sp. TaxID=173975 RepID=UPI00260939CD|nr:hypothetical protein [uncultured Shewanella sp.]